MVRLASSYVLAALVVASALAGTTALSASEPPWQSSAYSTTTLEPALLSDILKDFAADQGLPLVVSPNVTGKASARYTKVHPREFLEDITQANGLVWYFDGHGLYIYQATEMKSELLTVPTLGASEFVQSLKELGVYSQRYPVRQLSRQRLMYVVGPPRYIEAIGQLAAKIEENAALQAKAEKERARVDIVTEVVPLKYGWADDQAFFIGPNEVVVPGVATILRNLITGQTGPSGSLIQQLPRNRPSLIGQGLIRPRNNAVLQAQQAAIGAQIAAARAQGAFESTIDAGSDPELAAQVQVVIQADPRRNAVIVRDVKERMAAHRDVIAQLDMPHGMVQIKATIVDIDADHGFEFGPPYQAVWRNGGKTHTASLRLNTPTGAGNLASVVNPAGNFTLSLTSNAVTELLANIQALETEGHARVVSKPSVLTLDNIQAYLNESEEFFVRVAGFEQADLFNVTVGTTMRIVPHIVYEPQGRKVKLNIHLEDGARSATASVDNIPVVSRNTINTQAVLLEGQSLLIAGLMRENTSNAERRIPVLGRLPYVGFLAKETDQETRRFERMVLLTPVIVDVPGYGQPHAPLHTESPPVSRPGPRAAPWPQQPAQPALEHGPVLQQPVQAPFPPMGFRRQAPQNYTKPPAAPAPHSSAIQHANHYAHIDSRSTDTPPQFQQHLRSRREYLESVPPAQAARPRFVPPQRTFTSELRRLPPP